MRPESGASGSRPRRVSRSAEASVSRFRRFEQFSMNRRPELDVLLGGVAPAAGLPAGSPRPGVSNVGGGRGSHSQLCPRVEAPFVHLEQAEKSDPRRARLPVSQPRLGKLPENLPGEPSKLRSANAEWLLRVSGTPVLSALATGPVVARERMIDGRGRAQSRSASGRSGAAPRRDSGGSEPGHCRLQPGSTPMHETLGVADGRHIGVHDQEDRYRPRRGSTPCRR